MKYMIFLTVLLSFSLSFSVTATARPIPPSQNVFSYPTPGSRGFDREIINLNADTDDFDSGRYYIRVNIRERRLVNYYLPQTTFTHYCGYYRATGGSVGDYKPKNIVDRVGVFNSSGAYYNMSSEGVPGQDYNETPVIRNYTYHPRGTKLYLDAGSVLINACISGGSTPRVTLVWDSFMECRWKPEIWHKPSQFQAQYTPPLYATVSQSVALQCINF